MPLPSLPLDVMNLLMTVAAASSLDALPGLGLVASSGNSAARGVRVSHDP